MLVSEEYALRKGISTETAVFKLTYFISKSVNWKMHVVGIFCDLTTAYYCVNHDILLATLHLCCIQGVNADCLMSSLKNREKKF